MIRASCSAVARAIRAAFDLDRRQVRSVFSLALLGGIIALSVENWILLALAYDAIRDGGSLKVWWGLLIERTRYNSALQGWFAVIMALVVFGADYFRAKYGDSEVGFGRRKGPSDQSESSDEPAQPATGEGE